VTYTNSCPDDQFFDEGCSLEAAPGDWSAGEAEVTLAYQWYRNAKAIAGANGQYYDITQVDRYKNITVSVTGTAPGFTSTKASSEPAKTLSGKICTILGTPVQENLTGTKGADIICGRGGSDVITPLAGNDVIDGGGNDSTVAYATDKAATTVVLPATFSATNGSVKSTATGKDTLIRVDNVFTGSGNDTITGNARANVFRTGAGNDTVRAGDEADHVNGGTGNDKIYGEGGDDRLAGLAGVDTLDGGAGDDLCDGFSTYSDTQASCDVSNYLPTLTWTSASMNGLGIQIDDELGLIQSTTVFLSGTGKFDWGQEPLVASQTTDSAGLRRYEWFNLDQLKNNTWGRKFIIIMASTEDGRFDLWRGQANDMFIPNSDPNSFEGTWTTEIGAHRSYIDFDWDVTPPVIEGITASSTSVDASSTDQTVTFTAALAGGETSTWNLCFLYRVDGQPYDEQFYGSATDSNSCEITIPANTPLGMYGLSIDVQDAAGNVGQFEAFSTTEFYDTQRNVQSIDADFAGAVIELTGSSTWVPINIGPVTFSAATVSTRTAAKKVTATFDVITGDTPDTSTLVYAGCTLKNPLATSDSVSADAVPLSVSSMRVTFTLPKGSPKGKYVLECYFKSNNGWRSHFIGHTTGEFTWTGPGSSTVNSDSSKPSYITVN
jgi:Ca2+-binding RTX toxin-like protein